MFLTTFFLTTHVNYEQMSAALLTQQKKAKERARERKRTGEEKEMDVYAVRIYKG